jgi:hypothetical protein
MILFNSARESDGLIVMRLFPQLDCTLRIIGGIPFYYCYSLSSIRVIWLAVAVESLSTGKLKRAAFSSIAVTLFPRYVLYGLRRGWVRVQKLKRRLRLNTVRTENRKKRGLFPGGLTKPFHILSLLTHLTTSLNTFLYVIHNQKNREDAPNPF